MAGERGRAFPASARRGGACPRRQFPAGGAGPARRLVRPFGCARPAGAGAVGRRSPPSRRYAAARANGARRRLPGRPRRHRRGLARADAAIRAALRLAGRPRAAPRSARRLPAAHAGPRARRQGAGRPRPLPLPGGAAMVGTPRADRCGGRPISALQRVGRRYLLPVPGHHRRHGGAGRRFRRRADGGRRSGRPALPAGAARSACKTARPQIRPAPPAR